MNAIEQLTEAERVRLRELADAATPGPWEILWNAVAYVDTVADPSDPTGQTPMQEPCKVADAGERDRDFIAAARTAVPALLDALEAAERERDAARKATQLANVDFTLANEARKQAEAQGNKLADGLHKWRDEALAAEAENQHLREGIEALAAKWDESAERTIDLAPRGKIGYRVAAEQLRALLSTSSVRGEGDG